MSKKSKPFLAHSEITESMHFLNTVVGLCTDIYDDTDAGGDAERN